MKFIAPSSNEIRYRVNSWLLVPAASGRYFSLRRRPRSETGSLPASIVHQTTAALAALPEDQGNPDEVVGRRLTGFLRDLAGAWQVATPAERNKIARQLFVDVIVENRTAVAVVPRPDVRPFFETLGCQVPEEVTRWRKPRDSDPHARAFFGLFESLTRTSGLGIVATVCGSGHRFGRRVRKLTAAEASAIHSLAATKSLRSLAAEFGVSHETVRTVLRQTDCAVTIGEISGLNGQC